MLLSNLSNDILLVLTKYDLMPRSVEKLTQLQIAMDHIQKHWIV